MGEFWAAFTGVRLIRPCARCGEYHAKDLAGVAAEALAEAGLTDHRLGEVSLLGGTLRARVMASRTWRLSSWLPFEPS